MKTLFKGKTLKSALNAIQDEGNINHVKELIKNEKTITREKMKEVKSIGLLLDAIKENKGSDFTDGREVKEMFQKVQFLDLIILMLVLAGTFLCFKSVNSSLKHVFNPFSTIWSSEKNTISIVMLIFTSTCFCQSSVQFL